VIHRGRALIVSVLLAGGVVGVGSSLAQAASRAVPTLQLSETTLVAGRAVTLAGVHWVPNTALQASVCGANAVDGSVDCAVTSSVTFSSGPGGVIEGTLLAAVPPQPCPCVVLVVGEQRGYVKMFPVTIVGVPVAAVGSPEVSSHIVVVDAHLIGSTPIAEWFGFSATRTLAVSVRNTGSASAFPLRLFASLGITPVVSQRLTPLGPGKVRNYEVPVTFPALSVGNLTLNGHISSGNGQLVGFKVPVAIWPFGLLVAGLIIAQIILLAWRNVARRRYERNNPPPAEPEDPPTMETEVVRPLSETV